MYDLSVEIYGSVGRIAPQGVKIRIGAYYVVFGGNCEISPSGHSTLRHHSSPRVIISKLANETSSGTQIIPPRDGWRTFLFFQ